MFFKRLTLIAALSLVVAACSPNAQNPTQSPTNQPAQVDTPAPAQPDVQDTPLAPVAAAPLTESTLTNLDPERLDEGSFEVEIINPQGTRLLERIDPTDDESEYTWADYNPASEFLPDVNVSFNWNRRVNQAWYTSKVSVQLPGDVAPGTYPITGSALLGETGIAGAYVDSFSNDSANYAFYEQYDGSVTITEVDEDTISGSFTFTGRTEEGQVSQVTGVFNDIAISNGITG